MKEGPAKERLKACGPDRTYTARAFSISHRGAPLQFPEHTREGVLAAARMGAGIIECDVAFTKDRQLVCRHAQCDLHTTTDILARPDAGGEMHAARSRRPIRRPAARPPPSAARATSRSPSSRR